ncbi:nickel pincer cofactor biosynthesis protein LarB [candidate division KSB1 bacterium]|nr:nickel pincer cofactor biosynthesis protein LarB [candidate division KSB1 bacterium]
MDQEKLKQLLLDVKEGRVQLDEAMERLRILPYEDVLDARLDMHRALRQGLPEVVFCQGKTIPQAITILEKLWNYHDRVLATRVSEEMAKAILEKIPAAAYDPVSRLVKLQKEQLKSFDKSVPYAMVLTGGTSDLPVAEEAAQTIEFLGNRVERAYDVGVAGIHRVLAEMERLFEADVVISVAGMEGALTSVVAGLVACPVIGVPTSVGYGANFQGLAPLLTMLNSCATGVAVVNIDNGFGAGIYAHLVLQGIQKGIKSAIKMHDSST